jgi:hypothetical protein
MKATDKKPAMESTGTESFTFNSRDTMSRR